MNYTLEVKVTGYPSWRRKPTYEVIWLPDSFRVIQTSKRANNVRRLVSDGRQAFDILVGKTSEKYLAEHGFDPDQTYEDAALS